METDSHHPVVRHLDQFDIPAVALHAGAQRVDDAGNTVTRPGTIGAPVPVDATTKVVEFNDLDALAAALAELNVAPSTTVGTECTPRYGLVMKICCASIRSTGQASL